MGVFLFTRGFGFARGGRAPWSRRVDATTDHETHPSTLGPNRARTGVLCRLPLHSPPREKSRFFSREIFRGPPSVFPERGARRSARPRRDAPRHSRRAFARVGSPLVSRGLPRSVRARTRDVRARFALRQVEIPATVARARRVICRVCASASSSPARCAGVREFGLAGPAGRGRGRNRTARGNASRGIPPSSASRTRAPRPRPRAEIPS